MTFRRRHRTRSAGQSPRLSVFAPTLEPMPVSAHDVAAELRRQLPGVGTKKLHKLLYYCQAHHLAHFGEPLFHESIMAYDMGPVVAQLWYVERNKGAVETTPLPLGELNTVGYVVSRYGRLTGADLERLTHAERPWADADKGRKPGGSVKIDNAVIKEFFETADNVDDDLPWLTDAALKDLLAGAEERRAKPAPAKPDTVEQLLARLG